MALLLWHITKCNRIKPPCDLELQWLPSAGELELQWLPSAGEAAHLVNAIVVLPVVNEGQDEADVMASC